MNLISSILFSSHHTKPWSNFSSHTYFFLDTIKASHHARLVVVMSLRREVVLFKRHLNIILTLLRHEGACVISYNSSSSKNEMEVHSKKYLVMTFVRVVYCSYI